MDSVISYHVVDYNKMATSLLVCEFYILAALEAIGAKSRLQKLQITSIF